MTTLELFWISSCFGAVLCFAAGFVSARRYRKGTARGEAKTTLGADPVEEQLQWVRQENLELRSGVTRVRGLLIDAERGREVLATEVATLADALSQAQARSAESVQARRSLEQKASDLQSQLSLTKKRLVEAQASHDDYIRLRTRRDEDAFLKSEVSRLKAQLVTACAGGTMIPKWPGRRPRATGADLSKLTLSEALDVTVQGLIDERVGSVVLADEVGFAVSNTDEHGAALAAFSSLVTSAGDRAHSFAPVGKTSMISIVDEGGAQISIWPFDQDGSRLSLVTLSRSPLEHSQVSEILVQVGALLDRPRTKAEAV